MRRRAAEGVLARGDGRGRPLRRASCRPALALAALLLAGVAQGALAGERHALLIGNGAYESLPVLDNPTLDVGLLARRLARLDFTVEVVSDAGYDRMRAAIDAFRRAARGAEVALVYYAGHGVQVDGVNYLLPIDARIRGREDLRRAGLVVPFLLHELEAAAPEFGILVLDACRDDPIAAIEAELARQAGRSLAPSAGLAPTVATAGLLIAYATAPGQVALDGPVGANSPFAEALAHYLDEPGLEIGLLFRKVSAQVRAATAGAQVPWTEASLTGKSLVLNPAPTRPEQTDAIAELNRALDLDDPLEQRLALATFVRTHAASPLAVLAEAYLERLERQRPQPGVELASFERAVADRQRVELLAGSVAASLAEAAFTAVHPAPVASPAGPERQADAAAAPPDAASLVWPLVAAADRPDTYAEFLALFPDAAAASAAAAGLQFTALADDLDVPPASAEAGPAPLTLPVVVGTGPVAIALAADDRRLVLEAAPRHGRLRAFDAAGNELLLGTAPVAATRLEYLPPTALRQGVDAARLRWLAADGTGAMGEPLALQLEITVDDCDRLAGARFDRQGVVLGNFPTDIDPDAAVAACARAVEAWPGVARFAFQLGRALEAAGDYGGAAERYAAAGTAGHLLAVSRLGYLHLVGLGVPADTAVALGHFEAAAAGGEPYAMNSLARLYAAGEGVAADRKKAIDWYLRAAALGHTFAYNNLGHLLAEAGEADRALPLFRASAEAGDVYGSNNLGYAYQHGIGVAPDLAQAIVWYERAARGGQPNAPINLGFIYRDGGPGIAADPKRAAFWFAQAASAGNPWGTVHLAALHAQGVLGPAPDPVRAAKLLARVAWIDPASERHAAQQNYGGAGAAARERFAALPVGAVVQAVQEELARLGFDVGRPDGLAGPRTASAIEAFLASHGRPNGAEPTAIELLGDLVRRPLAG